MASYEVFNIGSLLFNALHLNVCEMLSSAAGHKNLHLVSFLNTLGKHILKEFIVLALILNRVDISSVEKTLLVMYS